MKTIEEHAVMKERPILFSGPMIRALNEGRKTQTRRLVKPQPPDGASEVLLHARDQNRVDFFNGQTQCLGSAKCPYGQPGDRLIVRETFYQWGYWSYRRLLGGGEKREFVAIPRQNRPLLYAADGDPDPVKTQKCQYHKRPSIFLPKENWRLALEITSIRVEWLQDISEEDALAEGIEIFRERSYYKMTPDIMKRPYGSICPTAYDAFRALWESINGPGSWDANPWVWVITFKRAGVLA